MDDYLHWIKKKEEHEVMLDSEKNSFNELTFLVKSNQFSDVVLEKVSSKFRMLWVTECGVEGVQTVQ